MTTPIACLFDAFGQIDDPRKARGVRHPFSSILALTFLGLLCRQTDMASLERWAADHWKTLKGPLGFRWRSRSSLQLLCNWDQGCSIAHHESRGTEVLSELSPLGGAARRA
jgi:hypothetical protein